MVANDGNAALSLFGLETRAEDDRLLSQSNKVSESRKRYEKALEKGLQSAKAQVDQFYQEDNNFPDLYERLLNQTEAQNYFFEPYVTQWRPQVVKRGSLVTYPSVVASSIEETKTLTLSGLLEEISHAWTSVDNRLFVWNYRNLKQFAALEFDQAIVAVSLCESPASGIFTDKVQHLLVVATIVDISLVAVLFDPFVSPGSFIGSTNLALKLQRTKLGVSTDNCVVRSIACTQQGRIFFGGSDGTLYELCYSPEAISTPVAGLLPSFFSSSGTSPRCSKVAHTTNYTNFLPSFLVGFAGSLDKIHQIALDSERNILYVLHDQAHVEVFDLGYDAKELKLVCSLNLLSAGRKYAREHRRTRVSCPDEKLFQKTSTGEDTTTEPVKFIYICPVPRNESSFITLLAVTSNGLRFYLTVYSKSTYSTSTLGSRVENDKAGSLQHKRPTRLELIYIRLPPPAVDINDSPPYHTKEGMQPGFVPGKSPSQVHSAYYRDGVFLLANGGKDKQDQFIGIAYDAIATTLKSIYKPTVRESVSLDNTLGKVIDIKGLSVNRKKISSTSSAIDPKHVTTAGSKRSFDTMSTAGSITSGSNAIIGEMTSQFSEPPRHFLTLTNAGIQLYRKIRPLDQLQRVLLISRGSELKRVLAPFVRCFGETEVCSMLLAIACGVQSDAIKAYSSVSSEMVPAPANGVKCDEYLHSAAIQGIFDCGLGLTKVRKASTARKDSASANDHSSIIAPSTRVILKSESEMSYYHDALILFLSRVMRPLWKNTIVKLSTDSSKNTCQMVYDFDKLCDIREVLFQLRQLMENTGPFSVAVGSGAASLEASAAQKSLENDAPGSEAGETDTSRVSQLSERFSKTRSEEQLKQEKRFRMEQQSLYFQYRFVCRSIEVISLLDVLDKHKSPPSENLMAFGFGDLVASTEGVEVARAAIRKLMQSTENEQNAQLIQQLRTQCPSFFFVPDLWHYQGYKSLSSAKLSTAPSAQRKYLQEALSQFLKACHMWNSEDGIEVLRNICEDFIALHFYEGVVKLSLACARNFGAETKANNPPTHSSFVVTTGVSAREEMSMLKHNCFGPILLALQKLLPSISSSVPDPATSHKQWYSKKKPKNQTTMNDLVCLDEETRRKYVVEILHSALASEDEDLHILLYSWLKEHGHTRILLSIRSAFIEPFLQSQNRDLLIQLYMEQQKYLLAANVWWELAREDHTEDSIDVDSDMNNGFEQVDGFRDKELTIVNHALLERNPDITKRQYYVSKTLACLKNLEQSELNEDANSANATREVLDIMDVLNLQARIFTSLSQSLTELEADVGSSAHEDSAFNEELSRRRDDLTLLKYKMLNPSTLYNQFAVKYSMWAECLHIIRVCRSDESDTVAALWRKIIFDVIPRSSTDSHFNDWLAKMRQESRLMEISADASTSFESGVWIGQVQCIVQRLGRILLTDDRTAVGEAGYTHTTHEIDGFSVFPVTFLLRELETLSLWYSRATQLSVSVATTTLDVDAFNWVVRLFADIGLPYQIILGNYEELYREQGNFSWGIHLMRSIKAAINMWRKNSIASGDRDEELSNFATCVPHLVELCDDILTDLQAVPSDADCEDVFVLLDDYRDLKRQLINFRSFS
uniref:Nuclear pore complex protein Nup155 putative n=1 Tax=Albugo laibachii Nc14 TaxID=890382 RepID=F0WJE5_9STRA|nr:nuclear pore complex protein Nup155 putative [Albugo laibachii Nc14]|eukprot:CCA21393.1 nuclear pore complex protein Nup155 putative [Albugo laibachii Nc14]